MEVSPPPTNRPEPMSSTACCGARPSEQLRSLGPGLYTPSPTWPGLYLLTPLAPSPSCHLPQLPATAENREEQEQYRAFDRNQRNLTFARQIWQDFVEDNRRRALPWLPCRRPAKFQPSSCDAAATTTPFPPDLLFCPLREVKRKAEQLRLVAELSAVTCGFALMGFFQLSWFDTDLGPTNPVLVRTGRKDALDAHVLSAGCRYLRVADNARASSGGKAPRE